MEGQVWSPGGEPAGASSEKGLEQEGMTARTGGGEQESRAKDGEQGSKRRGEGDKD